MEQKQEMHDVVEMLLSRMRDYPEDFYVVDGGYVYNKWLEALNTAKQVMRPEEKAAVESALEKAKRAVYMGAALKTMMGEDLPVEEEVVNKNQYKHQTLAYPTSITTASTNLTTASSIITDLEQRQKAMEEKLSAYTEQQAIRNTLLG